MQTKDKTPTHKQIIPRPSRRFYAPLFLVLFFTLFLWLNSLCVPLQTYCSTWDKIQAGEGPEILIMGNSHANKSFIPEILDSTLGIDSGVLSSSNQFMEMTTANLKLILGYYTPKAIILEAYAPATNTKDVIAKSDFYQNSDGMHNIFERFFYLCRVADPEDIPAGLFPILRSNQRWRRVEALKVTSAPSPYAYGDREGFIFSISTHATGNANIASISALYRESYEKSAYEERLTPRGKAAFLEFLELCETNSIDVYIVKAPTVQKTHMHTIMELRELSRGYDCVKLIYDSHPHMASLGLTTEDFYDNGHLSRRGSARFTEHFAEVLGKALGKTPDFGQVFFYRGESVTRLKNGLYRWQMRYYGENLYRFEQCFPDGTTVLLQDFNEKDYVDLPASTREDFNVKVTVQSKTNETLKETITFMSPNACVL